MSSIRSGPPEDPRGDARRDARGDGWEQHADWWITGFTDGADPEYEEQILPLVSEELDGMDRVLDIGCGEGQISRLLAGGGAAVIGADPTWNQVRVARERGGGAQFLRATADALPFPEACFDAAVACLVFEHIDAVDAALLEVARILAPGGRFALFLNHPIIQAPGSGWIDDHTVDPPEEYWRLGPYLTESSSMEQVEKGVWIRFVHRPMSRYINSARAAGLVLERMLEPAPPAGFLSQAREYTAAAAYPRLLYLRLVREA